MTSLSNFDLDFRGNRLLCWISPTWFVINFLSCHLKCIKTYVRLSNLYHVREKRAELQECAHFSYPSYLFYSAPLLCHCCLDVQSSWSEAPAVTQVAACLMDDGNRGGWVLAMIRALSWQGLPFQAWAQSHSVDRERWMCWWVGGWKDGWVRRRQTWDCLMGQDTTCPFVLSVHLLTPALFCPFPQSSLKPRAPQYV